jgi:hypothetical protein
MESHLERVVKAEMQLGVGGRGYVAPSALGSRDGL